MSDKAKDARLISVDKIFLDPGNPRFPRPFETEDEAIAWLCQNEDISVLAKNIKKMGLSQLEPFAVMKKGSGAYITLDGNRRLCAVRLLNDPDRAPTGFLKREFRELSKRPRQVTELWCVEYPTLKDSKVWVDKLHGGRDEGRGRSEWGAETKARRIKTSSSKANQLALKILDYARAKEFLTEKESKKKISIIQRFFANRVFKHYFGIEYENDEATTDISESNFNIKLHKFFRDVAKNKVNTRTGNDRKKIEGYANLAFSNLDGLTDEETERSRRPISDFLRKDTKPESPKKPIKQSEKIPHPEAPEEPRIERSPELAKLFSKLSSLKLERMYDSITIISAKDHCPLLYIGLWSIIESLTRLHGRPSKHSFTSYLKPDRLQGLGLGNKGETKGICGVLGRISQLANDTKHDGRAGGFHTDQLIADYQTIEPVLIKLAEDYLKESAA